MEGTVKEHEGRRSESKLGVLKIKNLTYYQNIFKC